MHRLLVLWLGLAAWGALAQGAPAAGSKGDEGAAPEKPAKPEKPPLDVERLPFTPDSIMKVISYHQDEIQSCYEETLAVKEKPVAGKLMTSFTITPTGLVKGAKVVKKGTTLHEPKLHDCVVAVLSAMTFPKPPDGTDHPVEFPFNLKPIR